MFSSKGSKSFLNLNLFSKSMYQLNFHYMFVCPGDEVRRSGVVSWLEEVLNAGEEKAP